MSEKGICTCGSDMKPGRIHRPDCGLISARQFSQDIRSMQCLPGGSADRKTYPMATGLVDYFPRALAAIAQLSYIGNQKHNPGQPLHWSRDKSSDHPDCLMRHFVDRGKIDNTGTIPVRHSTEVAWRALAILELEIEEAEKNNPPMLVPA
jgi:hypothetical protein